MDIRVPMEPIAQAFGVDATVGVEWKSPVAARGIWLPPDMNVLPAGGSQQRVSERKVMALLRSEVPEVPRKTIIDAPEVRGGAVKRWEVDAIDHSEPDHVRVVLLEKELFP